MAPTLEYPTGLTTTEAAFIENSREHGRLYIEQPYELYTAENHEAWRRLYARMTPLWARYANEHFLRGVHSLCLDANRVPKLEDVNRFLSPLTGFRAKAVSGYVPAYLFFESLRNREFPTTITIRDSDRLDYLPEPDIFHDIAGHVPMHTDRAFADTLVRSANAPYGGRTCFRDPRSRSSHSPPYQHHQSHGPVLLVHHRVRINEHPTRIAGLWQRSAEFAWRVAA